MSPKKRVLISLAIGVSVVIVYFIVCFILILPYRDKPWHLNNPPAYDIGLRLPTLLFKYLFPTAASDFYKPGFTLTKLMIATVSFLINMIIYSIPPYVLLSLGARSQKPERASEPPPPPSF